MTLAAVQLMLNEQNEKKNNHSIKNIIAVNTFDVFRYFVSNGRRHNDVITAGNYVCQLFWSVKSDPSFLCSFF